MRHLNQIVFLNSANIPYAEVMIDGNVHFAGTQGVGKSTVLRALLFFYNADKMRLGIQPGQKSFEEFYFRYSNSYIVYEVKTEHGAYSILTRRSQGKAVFRFIDAPYRKAWLVDSGGRVESDWIRIREHIGPRVDISPKIETYEFYRNIIFGNTRDRSHRYNKYAIVESHKYQNIPRSIQNVFLNSKLDADFVKNTIIQSMAEQEDTLELFTYRHLVADFEREFNEIDCWYRKDNSGEIPVRNKAAKVVETYRLLVALDYEMRQTWHQLNHAVSYTREQIPLVEDEIKHLQEKQKKTAAKLENLQHEYEKEHDRLTKIIGKCDVRLKDIRDKRRHYEEIDIKAIFALDSQEPKLRVKKNQKELLLHALEEQYKDVTEKFKALYATLDSERAAFTAAQKEDEQRLRDNLQTSREKSMQARDKRKKAVEDAYDEWLTDSDERFSALQQQLAHAEKRLADLNYWHPMEKETTCAQEDISRLQTQRQQLENGRAMADKSLKALRQEGEMKYEQTEKDYARKQEDQERQLKILQQQLADTDSLLDRWKGSLYEWLETNKSGWEDTIGKVVDEQQVLYAQGLSPQLSDGHSLFGVDIQLEGIPRHHRSPDEYRTLQKQQQDAVAAKKRELAELQQRCKNDLENISKSYKGKLNTLQQQVTTLSVQAAQIPQKIKDAETRLHLLKRKEQEMIDEERNKRTAILNEALLNVDRENTSRTAKRTMRDKNLKAADSEYNATLKEQQRQFDDFLKKQADEKAAQEKDLDERRRLTEQQERDELKGKGADTQAIVLCRHDIEILQQTLDKIANQRRFVFEYHKDEEELFSHETEFREEKRLSEAKDAAARNQYEEKRKRMEEEQAERAALVRKHTAGLEAMREGLKQYDQMCRVENVIPESFMQDDNVSTTSCSCADLVAVMRGTVNRKRLKTDELKRATNAFFSHFGPDNTFHFITPHYDEDFIAFALNLQEFIENNKIEEYRSRVSRLYNDILRGVSREVGLLTARSAEIRGIIGEVNRDFRERNFAGVIKSIELRAEETDDRMMQLLRQIRDFTEENALNIGELNLFSNDDHERVNAKVVEYLKRLVKQLQKEPARTRLTLSDTFRLQFRIQENDNNTGWVERINNVGSDGTDVLVKAMVNIMLINVFKTRASRRQGDFIIHCMMDEIGKLHPGNVSGILQFANVRNIYLINSSPMGYNADLYKYNYLLTKDSRSQTHIKRLVTINA